MKRLLGITFLLVTFHSHGLAEPSVLINPGDTVDASRSTTLVEWKSIAEQMAKRAKMNLAIQFSTDATHDLSTTRSQLHDIVIGPAHVVGSAVRYGYEPLYALDQSERAVLVALKSSGVDSLAAAKGKRIGLPRQDSLVTYLIRGELNAANTTLKSHFSKVETVRYQEALLLALKVGMSDVVAVDAILFQRWVAAGEPVVAVLETRGVPGLGVALKQTTATAIDRDKLRSSLLEAYAARQPLQRTGTDAKLRPLLAKDFEYVATLGYFTPRSLPGATVVDAAKVVELMAQGAHFVDTRTEAEFRAGHVPGARLLPYHEKSAKETDFDVALDNFDLTKLPQARETPIIVACNGPECWKSYKSARVMIKAGYTHVYWFRGGFPEWRSSSRTVASL